MDAKILYVIVDEGALAGYRFYFSYDGAANARDAYFKDCEVKRVKIEVLD